MRKLFLGLVATAALMMAGEGMKCGAGKCGGSMTKPMAKKEMKCGAGKCGMATKDKNTTKKMKCGAGKCGGGK